MRLKGYANKNGYAVSCNTSERDKISDTIDDINSNIAWGLASKSGLRRAEISNVKYKDIYKRDTGDWFVRVYEDGAKRSKYRESPVPDTLATQINTILETNDDISKDEYVVQKSMRQCTRDLKKACQKLAKSEGKETYKHITLHDGRRTFANTLLNDDIPPLQVMQWGGWDDWRTFRDHYLQDYSTDYQHEQINKVDWL